MESKKDGQVFSTIGRIENKINSLRSVLSPVTKSVPSLTPESASNTELMKRLTELENNITDLLDTVEL